MLGLALREGARAAEQSPKGQLPFIDDEGARIADSHFIREHLEKKLGNDLDAHLDAAAARRGVGHRADAREPASRRRPRIRAGSSRRTSRRARRASSTARPRRRDPSCASELVRRACARRSARSAWRGTRTTRSSSWARDRWRRSPCILGDKPYLFGDRPAGVDATAFAVLAGILTPFFDSPLRRRAEGFANLIAYTARLMKEFFPDHPWEAPR